MAERAYLDFNATMPLRPEAREAMIAAMEVAGNPSSVHAEGRAARALVEDCRARIAGHLGCAPAEVVFTSGATEGAGVLAGFDAVEVQETAHDCLVAYRRDGAGRRVRAMGLANSETGVLTEPEGEGPLLLDVVQAVGRVPFAFSWSGADLALVSGHKFGGPKGVGALIVKDGVDIPTLRPGGGQEMGRRSGTENVAGIAGMAAALDAAMAELEARVWEDVRGLRDRLEAAIAAASPDTIFVGQGGPRLPNTTMMVTPGWKGETQVMAMDLAGFAVSAGSACSSGKVRDNRVLKAMGVADPGAGLRVSLGPRTTGTEVERFVAAWEKSLLKLRARAA